MRTIEGRAKRRADDCKYLKDRREPAIKPDQEPAIAFLRVEHGHATCAAKQSADVEAPRSQLQDRPDHRSISVIRYVGGGA